ncbi:YybH family protein [Terrarubrum flagellatum]|uniref:YybH family protein n=1 Tax=Terrirubrum flagellatum TaxID=2895980 RepID=UPI0031454566
MRSLPEADSATRAEFIRWLDVFAGYVREVDYGSARPLFHPDVLAFGTHRDVISGLDQWMATQWDNVWPKTSDFQFDLDAARILVSDDRSVATVIVPWTSTGYEKDGSTFDRPGRATMIFHKLDGAWLCVHSHMSLNRGVPQQSFANRPRKSAA